MVLRRKRSASGGREASGPRGRRRRVDACSASSARGCLDNGRYSTVRRGGHGARRADAHRSTGRSSDGSVGPCRGGPGVARSRGPGRAGLAATRWGTVGGDSGPDPRTGVGGFTTATGNRSPWRPGMDRGGRGGGAHRRGGGSGDRRSSGNLQQLELAAGGQSRRSDAWPRARRRCTDPDHREERAPRGGVDRRQGPGVGRGRHLRWAFGRPGHGDDHLRHRRGGHQQSRHLGRDHHHRDALRPDHVAAGHVGGSRSVQRRRVAQDQLSARQSSARDLRGLDQAPGG